MEDQIDPITAEGDPPFLNLLLDRVSLPIIVIDLDGNIILVNQHVLKLGGWGADEVVGRNLKDIVTAADILTSIQANLNQLKSEKGWSVDLSLQRKDGAKVILPVIASILPGEPKKLISLVAERAEKEESLLIQVANQILTNVDTLLGDVVDYDAMLDKIVQFVIPELADVCGIFVLQADGSLDRVALAPEDIKNDKAISEWLQNDLPNDETDGIAAILSKGESRLVTEVNPAGRTAKAGISSYMVLPLITHRDVNGVIVFISTKSGRHFQQAMLALAKNLAINISIYLEKNRLYKESQKLKAELEQRVENRTAELRDALVQLKQSDDMIQTLFRISKKLNATLDVEVILDELAQEAIQLVNGESGFAGLHTEEGMTVHKYFHKGKAIPFDHTWPHGEGIPGWVLNYKVPYGTSDAGNDPLIQRDLEINTDVRSVICTPILDTVGEVIGYFDIRNKIDAEGFSISDQEMLLTLAPVASIAIQNALTYRQRLQTVAELNQSYKQMEELAASLELAREEERRIIALELHDQLGQALTAMKFDLTALHDQLARDDQTSAQNTKDLITQVNTMIKTVRRISTQLRPGMLDELGLLASIEWQAKDFEKRTGIECTVSGIENHPTISRDQSLVLYRIAQEALTNVARYAGAKHVDISLRKSVDSLELYIHDDGRGIRADEISGSRSLGLLGMRERVKHIGGIFEIKGVEGEGTTIKVTIPGKLG